MADPRAALLKAILTALDGMTIAGGTSVPTYAHAQQGQAFPYVTIDDLRDDQANSLGESRKAHIVTFTAWSESKGHEQVLRILESMTVLLDENKFTLDTGQVADSTVASSSAQRDSDGVTYMGRLILNVLTHD